MKKLVAANWKMNPKTLAEAEEIVARMDEWLQGVPDERRPPVVVCPPFVFIEEVADFLKRGALQEAARLGAQDIALSDDAAQTGEVSGTQLAALGVQYVIVGHSERRWKLGEDDATVNAKLRAVLEHGMTPIVCVGERTREGAMPGGRQTWRDELHAQVTATFAELTDDQVAQCLVAYEPVWAISTNPGAHPDTPESAAESATFIRSIFPGTELTMLYGGSVNPDNVRAFLSADGIDGVLVGGASLRADAFIQILTAASV